MSQLKSIFQSKNQVDYFTKQAILAALYVVLTLLFSPLSFGPLQFRVSELLMFFILIDKRYIVGLTLGVFIANLFSPLGMVDLFFGTLATAIALLIYISVTKNDRYRFIWFIISISLSNAIIISLELQYLGFIDTFFFGFITIALSECILMILAVAIYKIIQPYFHYFKLL